MSGFLWRIYLYKFFDAFKLIGALFTLFFQQNGLNVFQISVLIGIWSLTQLVLEVPLGLIADKYSRRNILIIATLLLAGGFTLWLKGDFLFYALGMVAWGVRNALVSGTFEAFVYDELKNTNQERQYGKISGKLEGTTQLGFMFSAIAGGLIAQYSFNWVLILTIVSSLIAALILSTTKSLKPISSTGEAKYFSLLKNAFKEIKSSQPILFTILFISLVFGISGSADEYLPLLFNNLGLSTSIIGLLVALEFGMFALSGYSFQYWDKLKIKNWNLSLVVVSGVLLFIFISFKSIVSLPLVFIGSYLLKLALVKFDTDLQHLIKSDQRATVLSIKGLTFEIVFLITLLIFGFTSTKFGISAIIYLWALSIIFLVVVLWNKLQARYTKEQNRRVLK